MDIIINADMLVELNILASMVRYEAHYTAMKKSDRCSKMDGTAGHNVKLMNSTTERQMFHIWEVKQTNKTKLSLNTLH